MEVKKDGLCCPGKTHKQKSFSAFYVKEIILKKQTHIIVII